MHTLMQKGNFTFTFSTVSKRWTVRVSYCESGVERWHPWNVRFIMLARCFNLERNCSIIGGKNNLRQLNYPISLSWSQIWVFSFFSIKSVNSWKAHRFLSQFWKCPSPFEIIFCRNIWNNLITVPWIPREIVLPQADAVSGLIKAHWKSLEVTFSSGMLTPL